VLDWELTDTILSRTPLFVARRECCRAVSTRSFCRLTILVVPPRLGLGEGNDRCPRLASYSGILEERINLFEGAGAGFWVEEIDDGDGDEVAAGWLAIVYELVCGRWGRLTYATPNTTYVFHVMCISSAGLQNTTVQFAVQLAVVASAFAGPRTLSGISSTAQSQLMPCQPTEKHVQIAKNITVMTR